MKTKIATIFLLFIMLVSCTNIMVRNVTNSAQSQSGKHLVSYFLPKKVVEVKFIMESQVIEPTRFSKASAEVKESIKSATGKEVISESIHKLVLKQVELTPITLPDPKKYYSVDYRNSGLSKLVGTISISEDGLIQSGSSSVESKAYSIIQTGLESIAGIASSFIGIKKGLTDAQLKAIKSDSDLDKLAIDLLDKLKSIQDAKGTLISSTMNMDPKLFETRLSILKEQEDAVVQQLTGEITSKEYLISKTWDPIIDDLADGEFIKEYTIELAFGKEQNAKASIKILLAASIDKDLLAIMQNNVEGKLVGYISANNKKTGFYYNKPIPVRLKLYKGQISDQTQLSFIVNLTKQSSITIQIPQIGTTAYLPARLNKSDVKFYSDLGSIKEYSFTKDIGISPDEIKSIKSSADTIVSTIKYFRSLKESVIEEKEAKEVKSGTGEVTIAITEASK